MFQFTKKDRYSPRRKWEQPMQRVEYDDQSGQVYNAKQTKTIEITKDGIYSVTPDTHMLLDNVVVNVDVDKQDVDIYMEDVDTTGGDIEIIPDTDKVIGKVTIHAGHAPADTGSGDTGSGDSGSGGTEGGTGGTSGDSGTGTNP